MSIALPPSGCVFYRQGACLYDEKRNPGLEPRYHCARIAYLVRDWDGFMDRAESLGMDPAFAAVMWEQRQQRGLYATTRAACHDKAQAAGGMHEDGPHGDIPHCPHLEGGLCLLTLPRCPGRCPRYQT